MSDAAAAEWLAVAAVDLEHYPSDILTSACASARRECTYHGQIVPFVVAEADRWLSMRRQAATLKSTPPEQRIERQQWKPAPGELDAIKLAAAQSLDADRR